LRRPSPIALRRQQINGEIREAFEHAGGLIHLYSRLYSAHSGVLAGDETNLQVDLAVFDATRKTTGNLSSLSVQPERISSTRPQRQSHQQKQRKDDATRRRGAGFDNSRFHHGFSHAASKSGGGGNRQSSGENNLFHRDLQVKAEHRFSSEALLVAKKTPSPNM
jgi:hypothetical protein